MNKYLLDTHIFLWSLLEPERLKPDIATALDAVDNELWLSPITLWEVMVLEQKGRIELEEPPANWLKHVLDKIPFKQAVLDHSVAIKSRGIKVPHEDPADRFILATAIIYELTLITADRNMHAAADQCDILKN